ncbi:mitochondrial ribosome-associated GTPase 1 isoform X5 [Ahaetulla prasina]|uniref:mitochondrial ribosome-associated GTPase 1 isoform X5 n=1 Tax=Ahaetulla prasina TaxID=499056 RepID=UPI002647681D|nr:mitochondrial ribosome-associated GTPase 1 isoform X5 [Ahaetulla prasina]
MASQEPPSGGEGLRRRHPGRPPGLAVVIRARRFGGGSSWVPGRRRMRLAALLRAAGGGGGGGSWRERFECGGRDVARWFPGHMARGLKDMRKSLRAVDGLLEVHDARIPLSGRNPVLKEVLGIRPHLLVLNKMDLADLTHKSRILELLEEQGLQHVVFTDCLTDENIKKLVPILTGLIKNSQRYQRAENVDNNIMVIGVPNVGKSSVINSLRKLHLRKGKATPVGGAPGITRALLTRIQVSEKPLMYLLDTPGVLSPQIESIETGLKLALCGAIRDHLVGVEVIADYLLYVLNQQQQFSYVERYGLSGPCDEVESVLRSIARHLGKVQKVQVLTGTGDGHSLVSDDRGIAG